MATSRKPKSRLALAAKSVPASEQAYQAVKNEILANRLHAGDPVSPERFVRELGLSRTPVREAILRLSREGLIEIRPRLGTFVAHLDVRQIHEMYQVRQSLEGLAARLAAGRIPPTRLEATERLLHSQRTTGKLDCESLSQAGQELHRLIVECCGNTVLANMILSLQDHFTRFRSLSLAIPDKVLASHREHIDILKALKRGDGDRAQSLVHSHFEHAAESLLRNLLDTPNRFARPIVKVAASS